MSVFFLHLLYLFFRFLVVFCRNTRNCTVIVGFRKCIRKSIFLIRILRNAQFFEVFIEDTLKGKVAHGIGKSVNKFLLVSGLCHQSCAFCDLVDTFLEFYRLSHMIGTHHIENTCTRLYHVRAASACVCDRIMDPCLVTHMLSQKLHANIHKFYCIKGASSHLRGSCRVRGDSCKLVLCLDTGVGGTGCNFIDVFRMPGKGCVEFFPDSVTRHECLCSTALFSRTAIEDHGSGNVIFLKICFHSKCCRKSSCAKDVVSTSMTITASVDLFSLGYSCFLRKP